jgi:hypothetical protein
MVPIMSLWIPILLSAVAVFVASSLIHMVLPYHKSDYAKLESEDEVMEALRKAKVTSGDYMFPRPASPSAMKEPAFLEKLKRGPAGLMTIRTNASPNMGKSLGLWFIYCVVIGVLAAYVAGRALAAGAPFASVMRFAGTTAFACFAVGLWQNTIWLWRSATTTLKGTFDGLIYAVLTGAIFGWLWPH